MRTALFLSLTTILCAQDASIARHPDVAGAIRVFEAWIGEQMAYRALPGVAVGLIHDQKLVYSRGFGFADEKKAKPVTPATLFRMASHTKLFTAIAILQLRDQGKLRLDDPVSRHLPWFAIQPATDDDGEITIEHLITHGSGLPREAATDYWNDFRFPTKAEVMKTVSTQKAAFAPDTRWKYSNLAVSLAGYIVEQLSGESYDAYMEKNIFRPLGMSSSSIGVPESRRGDLALGFGRRMPDNSRKLMPLTDCRGIDPAAGLTSNVEDMARFVALQFRGGKAGGSQILKGSTLREMHRVRMLENNWQSGNGLGFAVRRNKEKTWVGHGGSLAGYKTQTWANITDKVGIVVLTNGDDSRPDAIASRGLDLIGEAIAKAAAPPAKPPLWDVSWSRFAGLYRTLWGDSQVVELNNSLVMFDPTGDDPSAQQKLIPQGNGVFKLDGPTGGGAIGELVTFLEENGRVTGMRIGYGVSQRVGR